MSMACQVAATPVWPGLLGAGVTLLVGAAAAWIAYNQFRIAQSNLRLALFDRRFAVVQAARVFLQRVTANADADVQILSDYQMAILDAPFLFGSEVVDFLEEIRRRGILVRTTNISLQDPVHMGCSKLVDRKNEALNWLVEAFNKLPPLLQPYMGFDEWRLTTPAFVARIGGALRFFKRGE